MCHERRKVRMIAAMAELWGSPGEEYFLRDRGQWYIDDFAERFGDQSFLSYAHPPGMSLAQDPLKPLASLEPLLYGRVSVTKISS